MRVNTESFLRVVRDQRTREGSECCVRLLLESLIADVLDEVTDLALSAKDDELLQLDLQARLLPIAKPDRNLDLPLSD